MVADPLPPAESGSVTTLCPHCAGERARFYRPGAPEQRLEVTSPEAAAQILVPMLEGLDREHCVALNLDSKHRLIATTTVSIGSVDHTFMSPREVYRDALLHGAAAIVVAHNHPSGDAKPSRDDELITRRLAGAGDVVGVELLDHLVIGHHRWVSLARRGVLIEVRVQQATRAVDSYGPRQQASAASWGRLPTGLVSGTALANSIWKRRAGCTHVTRRPPGGQLPD